jgi:hypothetical protein
VTFCLGFDREWSAVGLMGRSGEVIVARVGELSVVPSSSSWSRLTRFNGAI